MVIYRLYADDRHTGAGDRIAAAMVHDSPDVYVRNGVIFSRYLLVCSLPWIRSLADRQGCSGLRDRIIDSADDEYNSCPLSSRTQGAAMGLMGLVIMVAPVIGPALSGLVIDTLDWRWLFYMVIPVVLFSIIYAFINLKNVTEITKPRVDLLSIVMSTIGFGFITYGFSQTGVGASPGSYSLIAIGGLFLLLLIWRQLKIKEPLIDLSVFRYPAFSLVAVLIVVLMMVLFATTTLLPIYMQDVMQLTAFGTGLLLMPGCILNAILMPVTGKLFDKFGPRFVIMPGLLMIALSLWLFAGIDSDTTRGSVLFDHVLLFLGISFVVMPAQTAGMNQLPRHLVPHGTAIYNTLQQIAGELASLCSSASCHPEPIVIFTIHLIPLRFKIERTVLLPVCKRFLGLNVFSQFLFWCQVGLSMAVVLKGLIKTYFLSHYVA